MASTVTRLGHFGLQVVSKVMCLDQKGPQTLTGAYMQIV